MNPVLVRAPVVLDAEVVVAAVGEVGVRNAKTGLVAVFTPILERE